jgi:phosphatidylserine/phosphatidylglycerophosphate/cardiolipin synthase-like enzyme
VLLEGSPPGGVTDLQRWCVTQIVEAGGEARYFAALNHAPTGYRPRYRFSHAKFGVIDGRLALNGTDNLNRDSMPAASSTPVGGRRGYYLLTHAPPVAAALARLFTLDWAPDRFLDLYPYEAAHPKYGAPPPGFQLPASPVYTVEASPFKQPTTAGGLARFMVVSAPENAMRPDAGLHVLLQRAGDGDEILLEQLYEHKHWGDTESNPIADPNPRLQMIVEAARRGARVRLLLDSFFDDGESLRSNRATADYVRALAAAEGLDMEARLGNPTGGGIHAKLMLVRLGQERWSAVGSLNGGEVSHKLNREVVVLTDLPAIYERLVQVFMWDWERSQP